jgi:hypothetical protein
MQCDTRLEINSVNHRLGSLGYFGCSGAADFNVIIRTAVDFFYTFLCVPDSGVGLR